jgi:hypothetical protein
MCLFMNTIKHLCQPLANNNNKYGSSSASGTAEASMKCAICDRGFEYYSNLRRHIKTKHKIFGKQVKEYVVRHQTNSTTNQHQSLKPSAAKEAPTNASCNSSDSNNSSQIQQSASAIMMMSPQSAASNQNTSSNYMDLGLNSKSTLSSSSSSSNGKNSPLSSMSSSSMSSTKSLNKSANNSQR